MKIKTLKINSFRGISNLNLEFDINEPTVFIGVNGAGKSSILDCLAILLSWLTGRIQNPKGSGRFFKEEDINNKSKETHNEITIAIDGRDEVVWSLTHARKGRSKDTNSNLSRLNTLVENIHDKLDESAEAALPLAVYYPTNRAVLDIPLRIRTQHSFQQIAAYDQALTGGKIDFRRFFEWFRSREDLENELRLQNSYEYRDRQLEAVRKAIAGLLEGFSNLRVQRSPLRMTVEKQGQEFIINQLSDGEKCLLVMVGDLARRLAIANPYLENPLDGYGVVLIDEIELHLHPKWQIEVIASLTKTFSNCQFIVTTHSPQVISQVKWIHLLTATSEDIIVERIPSYGKDSNRILETLMGSRSRNPKTDNNFDQLFRLIDDEKFDEAKELRQQIAEEMKDEDPNFVRADWLIQLGTHQNEIH
ncbi:AAA family ATPase [Kamptonema sp. UHCC 0994]|uniref:AAA family ATPase n=1 Tax=Kamptonema sp. UHCC 0994 TaxID=3031329 RepID=UPI0023B8D9F8|nr:AAA family ATPase [Kamptonema sp. UHCC 0994]MDF0554118.1 AAA family ATPase [Kamptonema sp. UHCC 0994]